MAGEQLLDPITLHPDTAAVDEANLREALFNRYLEVGVYDIGHIAWWKRVQIDTVLDRDVNGYFWVDGLNVIFWHSRPFDVIVA
jgi:hypothetical protein